MEEDSILIQTVARAIISDTRGTLEDQIERAGTVRFAIPYLKPSRVRRTDSSIPVDTPMKKLIFYNELGGFYRRRQGIYY